MITAIGAPTRSGWMPRPTPSSAMATNPAARMPRQRVTSILCWANPRNAGSSVTDAIIVINTVMAAPVARPLMNARPMMYMPSSEMTTVNPANTTARPAVSRAVTVASSGDWPVLRPSR